MNNKAFADIEIPKDFYTRKEAIKALNTSATIFADKINGRLKYSMVVKRSDGYKIKIFNIKEIDELAQKIKKEKEEAKEAEKKFLNDHFIIDSLVSFLGIKWPEIRKKIEDNKFPDGRIRRIGYQNGGFYWKKEDIINFLKSNEG